MRGGAAPPPGNSRPISGADRRLAPGVPTLRPQPAAAHGAPAAPRARAARHARRGRGRARGATEAGAPERVRDPGPTLVRVAARARRSHAAPRLLARTLDLPRLCVRRRGPPVDAPDTRRERARCRRRCHRGPHRAHRVAESSGSQRAADVARRHRTSVGRTITAAQGRSDAMNELTTLTASLGTRLKERKETLAVAESSAGGLISAALLAVPGASAYFLGGAVIYTQAARRALLPVPDESVHGVPS